MSGDVGRKRDLEETSTPPENRGSFLQRCSGDAIAGGRKPTEVNTHPFHQEVQANREEANRLVERAQPQLPAQARAIIADLDAWKPPLANLPVNQDAYLLSSHPHPELKIPKDWTPEKAQKYLDRSTQAPGASAVPPERDVMRAYEQYCAKIEELWKLVHPPTYKLLKKYGLSLSPRGTITRENVRNGRHFREDHPFTGFGTIAVNQEGKRVWLIDVNLPPVEAIMSVLTGLYQVENVARQLAEGKTLREVNRKKTYSSLERVINIVELNHHFAEYGMPARFNPVENIYQGAYDQAIKDAYKQRHIGSHTSAQELRTLGQQAGRNALRELSTQVFLDGYSEQLPDDIRAAEEWGITSLKLGEPEFKAAVERWAQEIPAGQTSIQHWIWVRTQAEGLMALPLYVLGPGDLLMGITHSQVSRGMPVETAGSLRLEVNRAQDGGGQVQAVRLNNATGHYQADFASLMAHKDEILDALRKAGISTNKLEIVEWAF